MMYKTIGSTYTNNSQIPFEETQRSLLGLGNDEKIVRHVAPAQWAAAGPEGRAALGAAGYVDGRSALYAKKLEEGGKEAAFAGIMNSDFPHTYAQEAIASMYPMSPDEAKAYYRAIENDRKTSESAQTSALQNGLYAAVLQAIEHSKQTK